MEKDKEQDQRLVSDEPGSNFGRDHNGFYSLRQALHASLRELFKKLLVQENSELKVFLTACQKGFQFRISLNEKLDL